MSDYLKPYFDKIREEQNKAKGRQIARTIIANEKRKALSPTVKAVGVAAVVMLGVFILRR